MEPPHVENFREPLLFLTIAGVIVPLSRRLHISPVIGFLIAGVFVGDHVMGELARRFPRLEWAHLHQSEATSLLAEMGVVFLLFMIGLELSFERLARLKALVFGLGAAQVLSATTVLAALGGWVLGLDVKGAVVLGAALSLSSTAIVIPTLAERHKLGSTGGRAIFSVLLFQDLMVAPLLFIVAMLGARASGGLADSLMYTVLPAFVVLALLVATGRLVLRPLFHQVALSHSTEFFMAACLLVVGMSALATAAAGLSMALGAFVAGLLLAETEFRREIEVTIEPFKGLLLGLFFMTTGASLDLAVVAAAPTTLLALVIGLIMIKAILVYGLARAIRLRRDAARDAALMLAPGGEFAFVMITAAVAGQIVAADVGAKFLVAVTLSMMAIPLMGAIGARLPRRARDANLDLAGIDPPKAHGKTIIIGYGRVGQLVGDMLNRHQKSFVAVDGDAALVRRERAKGVDIHWGDATRLDFLRRCGVADASALVMTLDAPHAAERVVELARRERPDLVIVARARDAHHATALYGLGASDAIPETIEASLQLSEAVLVDIGVPMGFVIASIHEKRDEFRKLLAPSANDALHRGIRASDRARNFRRTHRGAKADVPARDADPSSTATPSLTPRAAPKS